MSSRQLGIISSLTLVFTVFWVILTVAGVIIAGPTDNFALLLSYVSQQTTIYVLGYLNAVLITLLATALYAGLAVYLQKNSKGWTSVALSFVPVYSVLNLTVYLAQVTLVPMLIRQVNSELLLKLSIHLWPESLAFLLNSLAYAILGLPSIIYACLMRSISSKWRITGVLLFLNGLACIVGLCGLIFGNSLLANGSMIGGLFFLLALIPMSLQLLSEN